MRNKSRKYRFRRSQEYAFWDAVLVWLALGIMACLISGCVTLIAIINNTHENWH